MNNLKSNNLSNISEKIKKTAKDVGFDFCGIAPAEQLREKKKHFETWLANDCHGKMSYLENNKELRFNPSLFFENAQSIIVLAKNYFPEKQQSQKNKYKVSKYALGKDYHIVIKEKLHELLDKIKKDIDPGINGRGFVDSAPIMEKVWAQKAGLGIIGKNGCLIIPENGSFFFLAELIIDKKLNYDKPISENYCENCNKCVENCPGGAISEEVYVNAKKCISYLTIELKDHADTKNYKNWIFGCDTCQDVCPYNKFAKPDKKNWFELNNRIIELSGSQWEDLSKEDFLKFIKKQKSPIARIKFEKLKRNIFNVKN